MSNVQHCEYFSTRLIWGHCNNCVSFHEVWWMMKGKCSNKYVKKQKKAKKQNMAKKQNRNYIYCGIARWWGSRCSFDCLMYRRRDDPLFVLRERYYNQAVKINWYSTSPDIVTFRLWRVPWDKDQQISYINGVWKTQALQKKEDLWMKYSFV